MCGLCGRNGARCADGVRRPDRRTRYGVSARVVRHQVGRRERPKRRAPRPIRANWSRKEYGPTRGRVTRRGVETLCGRSLRSKVPVGGADTDRRSGKTSRQAWRQCVAIRPEFRLGSGAAIRRRGAARLPEPPSCPPRPRPAADARRRRGSRAGGARRAARAAGRPPASRPTTPRP